VPNIRPATQADLAAIVEIQRSSREASAWDPLDFDCNVAEEGGRVVGFLVTRQVAPDEREILNLAVHPEHRRRGIARLLLCRVMKALPGQWFLEVRESNAAAIALYRSLGFEAAGRRENYYSAPAEAAIVMRILS
jgi:[ribosomal protein S18]-alanine N-acetyltransferase